MSEEPAIPSYLEVASDNRAAVIREINMAIEQLREVSAQFSHNEGRERLAMHQDVISQICELAKLIARVSK